MTSKQNLIYEQVIDKVWNVIGEFQPNEVFVLIALARRKYNKDIPNRNNNTKTAVFRQIVREDNVEEAVKKMLTLVMNYDNPPVRSEDFNLYLTVNPRDVNKAIRALKIHMAEWDFDENIEKYKRLESQWCSALQKKTSRSRKTWYVVDIDDDQSSEGLDEVLNNLEAVGVDLTLCQVYPSRNGTHVLSPPFNVQKFLELCPANIETKTDDCVNLWCGNWK